MKRFWIGLTLTAGTVLLMSCAKAKKSTEDEARIPVEVETVRLGDVVQPLKFTGDVLAENEVKVFSKIPDRIERFYVDEGGRVSAGSPIAKIFSPAIEQGVRQAEAGLAAAKAQYANMNAEHERAKRLFAEKAVSQQQFDMINTQFEAAKAQAEAAEAGLSTAKNALSDAMITAPFAGLVGKRYFEAGDMASPGMPVVTVVQMERVKAVFNATEQDLGRLRLGQETAVRVQSYPDTVFAGKIVKISPVLDPVTRMAKIEVLISNPGYRLKPGMFANVEVTTGIMKNTLVIPRHAVVESTTMVKQDGEDKVVNLMYAYVVDSSKAQQRKLDVLYVNHKHIAVAQGVRAGEQIVVSGQNNLRDGSFVTVVGKESAGL